MFLTEVMKSRKLFIESSCLSIELKNNFHCYYTLLSIKSSFVAIYETFWISYFISLCHTVSYFVHSALEPTFVFHFTLLMLHKTFWNGTEHQKCEIFAKANSAALFSNEFEF